MGTDGIETEHGSSVGESQDKRIMSFAGLARVTDFLGTAMSKPLSAMSFHRHQGCVWSGPKYCHQW